MCPYINLSSVTVCFLSFIVVAIQENICCYEIKEGKIIETYP